MTILAYISGFSLTALSIWIWKKKHPHHILPYLLPCIAILIGLLIFGICIHIYHLPQAAARTAPREDITGIPQIIAVSDDTLFVVKDAIFKIRLHDGAELQRYSHPTTDNKILFVTSVAWNNDLIVFTFKDFQGNLGVAGLGKDGWLFAPRIRKQNQPMKQGIHRKVYFDAIAQKFMLASFRFPSTASIDGNDIWRQEVAVESIDARGNFSEEPSIWIERNPRDGMGAMEGICRLNNHWYVNDFGQHMYKMELVRDNRFNVSAFTQSPSSAVICPGDRFYPTDQSALGYLNGIDIVLLPPPPQSLFVRQAPTLATSYTRMNPKHMKPETLMYVFDAGRVRMLKNGYLVLRYLSDEEARAMGHVEAEVQITKFDAAGKKMAENYLRADIHTIDELVFETPESIVLLSSDLHAIARFDAQTLQRANPLPPWTAIMDRLDVWGGKSAVFDFALALCLLYVGLLLLSLPGWIFTPVRPLLRMLTMRSALVYIPIAVPTLIQLISSAWHI